MDFGRALATSFAVGSNRQFKEGEVDETEQIGWGSGLIGVAIVVAVQLLLNFWPSGLPLDAELLRDISIVTFGPVIFAFFLFWLCATITGQTKRLPAAFLFLGIALAALQLVGVLLAIFGIGQSGFVIGLRFAVIFLAARGFLKIGWPGAIFIGLLVIAGFIGSNYLFLMLPSGRLLR